MGRLLRFNARQATFEHCKLQLITFIAVFLFARLLAYLHNDPATKDENPENFQKPGKEWKKNIKNMAHNTMGYAAHNILVVSIAAYAVHFQKLRWLMLPWLVTNAAIILVGIILSIYVLCAMASQIMTALAIAAFAVYFLGLMAYGLHLGVVSFCELGAANKAAPYILIELER